MCMNCIAGSLPYVGMAVGGLRVMGARARASRTVATAEATDPEQIEQVEERPQPISG